MAALYRDGYAVHFFRVYACKYASTREEWIIDEWMEDRTQGRRMPGQEDAGQEDAGQEDAGQEDAESYAGSHAG